MIKSTEKLKFSEAIINATKLGLIRLSVYNSVFNVNRRNNQFLCAGTVLDDDDGESWTMPYALADLPISNNENNSDSNVTTALNYKYNGIQLLYLNITPGAYEFTEIAELIKEETEVDVIIKPDKNTMKCLMEMKQGALCFYVENSIASLLGFGKKLIDKVYIHLKKLLIL